MKFFGSGGREPPSYTLFRSFMSKADTIAICFNPAKRNGFEYLSDLHAQVVTLDKSSENRGTKIPAYYYMGFSDDEETSTEPRTIKDSPFVTKNIVLVACVKADEPRVVSRVEGEELANYWNARYAEVDMTTFEGLDSVIEAFVTMHDPATLDHRIARLERMRESAGTHQARKAKAAADQAKLSRAPSKGSMIVSAIKNFGSNVVSRLIPSKTKKAQSNARTDATAIQTSPAVVTPFATHTTENEDASSSDSESNSASDSATGSEYSAVAPVGVEKTESIEPSVVLAGKPMAEVALSHTANLVSVAA
eukprot:Opistho-2@94136